MRVPVALFADQDLLHSMDPAALQQIVNVACLPGIVGKAVCMPDAHSGYGFPIGGIAAFDARQGGVVSAGGVGFDIACGVRSLTTGLTRDDVLAMQTELAEVLFKAVPAGAGRGGNYLLAGEELDEMLLGGADWAVRKGLGHVADLDRCEDHGLARGAIPASVSDTAKQRFHDQLGSLGSGNHYLEIQWVEHVYDPATALAFGIREGDAVISIHCGSRGLGHQIGKDYLPRMAEQAPRHGITLPDRELACVPINSDLGQEYLGAMLCGVNCALANRQAITHLVRQCLAEITPRARLELLYDVSHNTCKAEKHLVNGKQRILHVHRKGATRALGPGHPALPLELAETGQPVLVGGSMGTPSYILASTSDAMKKSFGSACHGSGRSLSRTAARKAYKGRDVAEKLLRQGVYIRSFSVQGIAEEAPGAYKDSNSVTAAAEGAGLVRRVARLMPLVCVKG